LSEKKVPGGEKGGWVIPKDRRKKTCRPRSNGGGKKKHIHKQNLNPTNQRSRSVARVTNPHGNSARRSRETLAKVRVRWGTYGTAKSRTNPLQTQVGETPKGAGVRETPSRSWQTDHRPAEKTPVGNSRKSRENWIIIKKIDNVLLGREGTVS